MDIVIDGGVRTLVELVAATAIGVYCFAWGYYIGKERK